MRDSQPNRNARQTRKAASRGQGEDSSNLEDVSFLRLPDVKAVTGLSKTSLYTLIRDRNFPAPVRLGPRAVAWVRSEVKQWAANRVSNLGLPHVHLTEDAFRIQFAQNRALRRDDRLRQPLLAYPWRAVLPDNQPTIASSRCVA